MLRTVRPSDPYLQYIFLVSLQCSDSCSICMVVYGVISQYKQVVKCVLIASFTNLYARLVTINK